MNFPISPPLGVTETEALAFWRAVEACLNRFHQQAAAPHDYSARLARTIARLSGNPMVYHDEPFNVAQEIAKARVRRTPQVQAAYEEILDRVSLGE
ncbi:MAG: hypothetical protein NTZ56_23215 [Acidobacteria bacterium]|nr:hypothetical protein [Acidobacteriota bacterium]